MFSKNLLAFFTFIALAGFLASCGNDEEVILIEGLKKEKTELLSSIDSLKTMYTNMVDNADTLTANIERANAQLAEKDLIITGLSKKANKADRTSSELRAEVSQLKTTKAEYENVISGMRNEIIRLTKEKSNLMNDLDMSEERVDALSYEIEDLKLLVRGMEQELDQRRIDGVKAANVRFEVQKKGDKPTASNNRARTIVMDFDLNDVPDIARGKTKLYFSIRDAKTGVPVKSDNPIKASINPKNGKAFSFIAQEMKEITLNENQRIELRHDLQTKLAKGAYRAAIYSDLGLIGAVSFRLR